MSAEHYEHVIGLERLNASLSKKVSDLEKELSIRTRHLMVRNDELKQMFQEEKLERIQAEKDLKLMKEELHMEEEFNYDECVKLKSELALLKQELKRKGLQ